MKTVQGQARKVDRITFTVVMHGDRVKILDSRGKGIATVSKERAKPLARRKEQEISFFLSWRPGLIAMRYQLACKKTRKKREPPWHQKSQVWMKSLRWRRNRKRPPRPKSSSSFRGHAKAIWWEDSCILLLGQYANRLFKKKERVERPWKLWAETVYSNLGKRRDILRERQQLQPSQESWECDNQRSHAVGGKPRIQMCFDWH